jgi:predicted nuclease of predicted toxin-antitoxin system
LAKRSLLPGTMRFSPLVADARCVRRGDLRSGEAIFDLAAREGRVVVSADTDFGTLLAVRKSASPSVILFRHGSQHRPADQAALLQANLPQLVAALESGSVAVIQPDRIRSRALPLIP